VKDKQARINLGLTAGGQDKREDSISIDEFSNLASRLVEKNLLDEAVTLYQTASKIFPESIAIRLNLGRILELQRKSVQDKERSIQESVAKIREKDDILAQHYLSLATLYYSRGQIFNAVEMLELSRFKNENVSKTRFLLGKILYDQGDSTRALEEFQRAKELDPFYEDIYKHLGAIYHEKGEHAKSLESFIDAYILSGGQDVARTSYYQRQIRNLLNESGVEDKKHYNLVFNERKEYFSSLANSLSLQKDENADTTGQGLEHIFLRLREMEREHHNSLQIAAEFKKIAVMQGLSDDEIYSIARISSERSVTANEIVFREEDLTEAIYFIQSGSVRIIKSTPYGEQRLASLGPGEFFGEMDFIDSLRCSADAIANEDSSLFLAPKLKLEEMFLSRKHIGVQFYWHFWKTLSVRIREANELLKSFFIETGQEKKDKPAGGDTPGETTSVDFQKKLAVLTEKGLSSKELRLLATFSNEQFYREGQRIFREGDKGDELYIILEGQVRISKYIPGVGEEALSILGKGDFFGEMALIDRTPRSADATAQTDLTVLPIERELLSDILSKDVDGSFQFLYILCKMLSRRLREIDSKIYQWRILAGGF
jgi:CRP/FNR family transcriptional regulator, cyclic AMP receptor protein